MKNYILLLFVLACIAVACNDEPIGQTPVDNIPPGPVSNIKVENTPGGAILTYTLPQDEDLLYVKAVYSLKDGVTSEVRASLYKDTLKISGFGDIQERQVSLIAVDRSENESVPVTTKIIPLEPPVEIIGTTLSLAEDFGGVKATWENLTRAEVSVVILKEDHNKEFVPIQTVYSTMAVGKSVQHGLDTIPSKFGIYVQDRWENRSEIKYFTLTPIYETQLAPTKFREEHLPGDTGYDYGLKMSNIWDGLLHTSSNPLTFYHSTVDDAWPKSFTFDLGQTAKLSRLVFWQEQNDASYGPFRHGNLKKFEVWGCSTLDPTGDWASWTKLADVVSVKPSGSPYGTQTNEDLAYSAAGEQVEFSVTSPKVRYIRIKVTETWVGGHFFMIDEMKFFGDNR